MIESVRTPFQNRIFGLLPLLVISVAGGLAPDASMAQTPSPFTIVAMPDIENENVTDGHSDMLQAQVDWIVDHRKASNIACVAQQGDVVSIPDTTEYDTASNILFQLNTSAAGLPWGILPGNHDSLDLTNYVAAINPSKFAGQSWYGGSSVSSGSSVPDSYSSYLTFTAGNRTYLMINVEYNPSTAVLGWAQSIITAHPGMPTIVNTHDYLSASGTRSAMGNTIFNGALPANPDGLIYGNPQVFMVLCGHIFTNPARQTSVNKAGLTVFECLADYQETSSGDGYLRLYNFDEANSAIHVTTYSPYDTTTPSLTDSNNQFDLPMNFTARLGPAGWSFVMFGDCRGDDDTATGISPYLNIMAQKMASLNPQLVIVAGDLCNGDCLDGPYIPANGDTPASGSPLYPAGGIFNNAAAKTMYAGQFDRWKEAMKPVFDYNTKTGIPIYTVRGNHENQDQGKAPVEVLKLAYQEAFSEFVPQNGPINNSSDDQKGFSWSFTNHNVTFVAADQYFNFDPTFENGTTPWSGYHQMDRAWITRQFQNSAAPFKVFIAHEPIWQTEGNMGTLMPDNEVAQHFFGMDDIGMATRQEFWNDIGDAGVQLYLCGHLHLTTVSSITNNHANPIIQLMGGNGGAPPDPYDPAAEAGVTVLMGSDNYIDITANPPVVKGTYGFSLATVQNNTMTIQYYTYDPALLSGEGTGWNVASYVTQIASGTYAVWASSLPPGQQGFSQDADGDAVVNGLEYALGLTPVSAGGTNGVTHLPKLAWTGSDDARLPALEIDLPSPGPMDVTYEVEVSDTLDGSWTTILEKVGNYAWAEIGASGATFTAATAVGRTRFTVTDPGAHHFLRLKVTSNP